MDFAHQLGLSLMLANLNNSQKQCIDISQVHRLYAALEEKKDDDDDDDEEGEQ